MASAGRIETDSPRPTTEDTTQTSNSKLIIVLYTI